MYHRSLRPLCPPQMVADLLFFFSVQMREEAGAKSEHSNPVSKTLQNIEHPVYLKMW